MACGKVESCKAVIVEIRDGVSGQRFQLTCMEYKAVEGRQKHHRSTIAYTLSMALFCTTS